MMRIKLISFLKKHPHILKLCWFCAKLCLQLLYFFIPQKKTQVLFASFGGRNFNDSPKAIYDEMCRRKEFDNWHFVWAFVNPEKVSIPRGEKIRMDSPSFFIALLQSRIWISNSCMDRDICLNLKGVVKVETWHGTPLKKICGDEHQNAIGGRQNIRGPLDGKTIRCAQSEYDRDIFARIFHATKESFLLCDLPRNDELTTYSTSKINSIKESLNIPNGKKIILYAPTYREYLWDANGKNLIAPPIHLDKWKQNLESNYVLLFRAHYTIGTALNILTDNFLIDVSKYPNLNDLYAISDMMISDYSSCFFDYSILNRPMFCFAYDLEEYEEKRGLYLNLNDVLPCNIHSDENTLLEDIKKVNIVGASRRTQNFHAKFAPHAGNASKKIVDEISKRISL